MTVVVFDVDDTLYDQFMPFELAMNKTFAQTEWLSEIPLKKLYQLFRHHSDLAFPDTVSRKVSLKDMRVYRIQAALKDLGIDASKEACQTFQDNYFYEQNHISLQPDMVELLNVLMDKEVVTGILSNGPTDHQQLKIDQLTISNWIKPQAQHISESIGYSKPDAEAFKVVEKSFPEAKRFLYVGDSYENDVIGAKAAGWEIIWLNKNNRQLTQEMVQPDIELTSYDGIIDAVLEFL